jgi:DNA primase large subunit
VEERWETNKKYDQECVHLSSNYPILCLQVGWLLDMLSNKVAKANFGYSAYLCREELRRWFLGMETTLFRQRFRSETPESQRRFMEECKLPYKAINTTEFEAVKDKLGQVARSLNQPLPTAESSFYKVPFEEVPELVASRRVFLQRGNAFVPRDQVRTSIDC